MSTTNNRVSKTQLSSEIKHLPENDIIVRSLSASEGSKFLMYAKSRVAGLKPIFHFHDSPCDYVEEVVDEKVWRRV